VRARARLLEVDVLRAQPRLFAAAVGMVAQPDEREICVAQHRAQERFVGLCPGHQVDDADAQALWAVRRHASGGLAQSLLDVGKDVVHVLEADREAHEIRRHTGRELLFCRELLVRGGSRMDSQRARVTDVGHV
jgi:hypothetical protein